MEGESLVSKARTAFHSAAAKAEKVFIDFKSDLRGLTSIFDSLLYFLVTLDYLFLL